MLRFLTSGESHGQALITILDGMPAGLSISIEDLNQELRKRQQGYGRGSRQKIESDSVEIVSGVRHGKTIGAPLALMVENRDWKNWQQVMSAEAIDLNDQAVKAELTKKAIAKFRPGHADLAGTIKYRHDDIRNVLERASARETAARVAVGAICLQFLQSFNIKIVSHVVQVGNVENKTNYDDKSLSTLAKEIEDSEMFCADTKMTQSMKDVVQKAWQEGDSLGGVIEVICEGLPVGLGSYTQWDEKLDGLLAQAIMSIQAMKAVEIGDGVKASATPGSLVHDAIYPNNNGSALPFTRKTNHAGGIEGGMTNGSRLKLRAYMKPIPTLRKGLPSVSFPDFKADTAHYERSDVCAVPAASVVVKSMVAFVLTRAFLNKFGGDSIQDIQNSLDHYLSYCQDPSPSNKQTVSESAEASEMELE